MSVDLISLLIGLALATVTWWVITRARPLLSQIRENARLRGEAARARRMSSVEVDHRRLVLRRAQAMHLAAPLFALDEIVEEPLLLAPPSRVEPEIVAPSEDVVTMTVPYMPAWPELAAIYGAPTLTLGDALAGDVPLVVVGQPGMGKTVALAYLATLAANQDEKLGSLTQLVPFLVHVGELRLPILERKELLECIVDATAAGISLLDLGRLEKFVDDCFGGGRALLLVDGYDELTHDGQQLVTEYLGQLRAQYPKTRMVVTGAPESLDGLIGLGFVALAVAPWNRTRQLRFLSRWMGLWSRSISREGTTAAQNGTVEPLLLGSWLDYDSNFATPLEFTLKLWAACAGDWLGAGSLNAIAAHVRRLAPANIPPAALEALAIQVVLTAQPIFDPRRARGWIKDFELPEEASAEAGEPSLAAAIEATDPLPREATQPQRGRPPAATPGLLGRLASAGLVVSLPGSKMRFAHPLLGSYLAGKGLRTYKAGDTLVNQPDWIGKTLTMRYFAAHADAATLVESMLSWSRLPMHRPVLTAARWLRDAQRGASWRGRLQGALAELVRAPGFPLSLRGQALVALATSGDPAVALLFRELIEHPSTDVAQLAALGAGAILDVKAIPALKRALLSSGIATRRAACLALVAIGSTAALEAVGEAILRGDDDLRRSAAEALANHPTEGHAMLKDGATMEDIPLRRAIAYGLGRIRDKWADDLLDMMRLHDEQWIVRNAAAEMIESRSRSMDPRAPRRLPSPSESPWLIRFAGTLGVGISPGASAMPILLAALKSSNGDERLAAVDYLKQTPGEATVKALYEALFGNDYELREAAFLALWEIAASGIKLPDPTKYGYS